MKYATVEEEGRELPVLTKVFVDDVVVPPRLRSLSRPRVDDLAMSIDAIGVQQPISIYLKDGDVVLVTGHHRLAAAKKLGWEEIPAINLYMDDIDRQLWEIDENLQRANLTPAEEAEHLKRRAELWEARNNSGKTSPTITATPGMPKGFSSETAVATGKSKRSINQSIHRAENIESDVMEAVQGTVLDKGVELDALAKMEPEEQRAAVASVESGETDTVREKPSLRERAVGGAETPPPRSGAVPLPAVRRAERKEQKRRENFEHVMGAIDGITYPLDGYVDFPNLTDAERHRADSELKAAVRHLRAFRRRLMAGLDKDTEELEG